MSNDLPDRLLGQLSDAVSVEASTHGEVNISRLADRLSAEHDLTNHQREALMERLMNIATSTSLPIVISGSSAPRSPDED